MMRIKVLLIAAVFGVASAANAATMTVTPNMAVYNVGDTITLTITGTTVTSDTAPNFFGDLDFNGPPLLVGTPTLVSATTAQSFGGAVTWTVGGQQGLVQPSGDFRVFDQLFGTSAQPISNSPLTAIVTMQAQAPGVVNFSWGNLNFFGATGSGAQITIVPEPGTLLLLGAGLGGLALVGRRRHES